MADTNSDLVIRRGLTIPASELQWRFSGSGGPGGQHANTSNTKVTLTWSPEASEVLTETQKRRLVDKLGPIVRVVAVDERSQVRNRDIALERLRDRVSAALVVRVPRRPTAPTRASVARRLTDKRLTSERKSARQVGRKQEE